MLQTLQVENVALKETGMPLKHILRDISRRQSCQHTRTCSKNIQISYNYGVHSFLCGIRHGYTYNGEKKQQSSRNHFYLSYVQFPWRVLRANLEENWHQRAKRAILRQYHFNE